MFQRELTLNIVVVVAAFILGAIGVFWLRWNLVTASFAVEETHINLARRSGLLGSSAELRKEEARAMELIQSFNRLIPIEDELINLESFLRISAERKGLTSSFSFEGAPKPSAGQDPGEQAFGLTLQGELEPLLSYMKDLEFKRRSFLFTINSATLESLVEGYQLKINATSYFRNTEI
jgi:hypothetical protein